VGKWDPYSRHELRRRRKRWLGRNARTVAVVTAGMAAVAVVVTWGLVAFESGAIRWYLVGATHATVFGATLFMLNASFLASDREAIHHVRGAWGEENTRDELRRARRRRLVWSWVDSIGLQVGDVDHLVVTRRAGLVAIDSKWRSAVAPSDLVAMAQSARKVQLRAEGIARTVLDREHGSHRARVQSLTVTPLVVVWGPAQREVSADALVEGIRFVVGRDLLDWLRDAEGEVVSRGAAKDVLRRLRAFRASARPDGAALVRR
jgi:hypothetical protein